MGVVFDTQWFAEKQRSLLFLLNNPITKGAMRKIFDIGFTERIVRITPYEFMIDLGGGKFGLETHIARKFGIRLYSQLSPLWNLCHQFDIYVANKYMPAFNLGFDTLTRYPNADADANKTTTDGFVQNNVQTTDWNTMRNAAGTNSGPSSASAQCVMIAPYNTGGTQYYSSITRGIFLFDTSTIPSNSTINSATLRLTSSGLANVTAAGVTLNSNVYSSNPASNTTIANSDYDINDFGTTAFSTTKTYADWGSVGSNVTFNFNADGKTTGIIQAGITKLGLRNVQHDVLGNAPTGTAGSSFANCISTCFADDTTADNAKDPQLYIEFTPPATGYGKVIFISR